MKEEIVDSWNFTKSLFTNRWWCNLPLTSTNAQNEATHEYSFNIGKKAKHEQTGYSITVNQIVF